MIHESVASEASMLVRIVGSATLTTVVSSMPMTTPRMSTERASQRRRDVCRALGEAEFTRDSVRARADSLALDVTRHFGENLAAGRGAHSVARQARVHAPRSPNKENHVGLEVRDPADSRGRRT